GQIPENKQTQIIKEALINLDRDIESYKWKGDEIMGKIKIQAKQRLHYHRNFSYAFTCIVFFLIGAPLGAIVKKGGIGMPVVISVVIFVLYYIINFSSENMTKNGVLHPTYADSASNIIVLAGALGLFYKANNDSGLSNLGHYLHPMLNCLGKFKKQKNSDHSTYQERKQCLKAQDLIPVA